MAQRAAAPVPARAAARRRVGARHVMAAIIAKRGLLAARAPLLVRGVCGVRGAPAADADGAEAVPAVQRQGRAKELAADGAAGVKLVL